MKPLLALLLCLPALARAGEAPSSVDASPALTLEQTDRLHRESSGFADAVLKRMAASGVDLKRLPPGLRSRVKSTAFEAARWAPEHFVAFAQLAPRMEQKDWNEVFGAVAEGPRALCALVRRRVDAAGVSPKVPTMDYERREEPAWIRRVDVDGDIVDTRPAAAPSGEARDGDPRRAAAN